MAENENGVFVVETADELKAWMKDFHERCDEIWTIPSCAVYAMLQFVECWMDNQWRPIATAPKDGTRVLLLHHSELFLSIGYWHTGSRYGWWQTSSGQIMPTRWCPIPAYKAGEW